MLYESGEGLPADPRAAWNWFHQVAENGDADAQAKLGMSYYLGETVAKDLREAYRWFREAASQGDV